MKKLIFALFAFVTVSVNAQVSWPSGAAKVFTPAYASTYSVSTNNKLTFVQMDSLTGNVTLNYGTFAAPQGSQVFVLLTAKTATRAVIFGTNVEGVTDSIAANKTVLYTLVKYNDKLYYVSKGSQN